MKWRSCVKETREGYDKMAAFECVIHCAENVKPKETVQKLTDARWQTVTKFCEQWVSLDGLEQKIAEEIGERARQETDGYHPTCYNLFTHRKRVEQAVLRKERGITTRRESPVKKVRVCFCLFHFVR